MLAVLMGPRKHRERRSATDVLRANRTAQQRRLLAQRGGRADSPGRPIVTVKPGEGILFRGEPRRVLAVEVYLPTGGETKSLSVGHLLKP